MKTGLHVLALLFLTIAATGQSFEWAHSLGGIQGDMGIDIAIDEHGNTYSVSIFSAEIDVDPSPDSLIFTASNYQDDILIVKLDSAENLVWAKQIGGIYQDWVRGIVLDTNSNLYITGVFRQTVDFDPGPNIFTMYSSIRSAFILKLDSNGAFVWANQTEGTHDQEASAIALDSAGNIFTAGYFSGQADFDPDTTAYNLQSFGLKDAYIQKLYPDGSFAWARQFGGVQDDDARGLQIDQNGNVLLSGIFKVTANFYPNPLATPFTSYGYVDTYMAKLSTTGTTIWAKQIGSASSELSYSVAVDGQNNVYMTGNFLGPMDFDPGAGTYQLSPLSGGNDIFLLKLDANGDFAWANKFGGFPDDIAIRVKTDVNNNVYLCGGFQGNAPFSMSSAGGFDGLVIKYNHMGTVQWARRIGSSSSDFIRSMAINNTGDIYLIGSFYGTCDLDPSGGSFQATSIGGGDIFVVKLNQCFVDKRVTQNGATLSSKANGISYQWLDCQTKAPVPGAIGKSYTPTANGSYSVYVSNGICSDTSDCILVSNIGLDEFEGKNVVFYPNPTKGLLAIDSNLELKRIEVFDLFGRKVHQPLLQSKALDITFLPAGSYILKLTFEEFSLHKIVIKE